MSAAAYDFTIEQGADFDETISLTFADRVTPAMNLTGATIESKLYLAGELVAHFDCAVVDGPGAVFSRSMSQDIVDNLTPSTVANYVHVVNVILLDGKKKRLLKGRVTVNAEGVI